MVLSYYYLSHVIKGLLQAQHDRCCNLVKLISIYFYYLTYLTMVNQCLTIFFSEKYVSLERSPLDEAKRNIKQLKKWKYKKCQRLTYLFNK